MSYKALYRTYRPQIFSEVVGQKVVVKTLQNALMNKKTSHAYLFSGPRGTGKTTVARLFAKALNCAEAPTSEPCLVCQSCVELLDGSHPDVVEIDAASNNGVDQIREIRDKVKYLPSGGKYRVYIIDEVHMLSSGAFNALLKVLEEPPKHVVFILATTEPQKVLPTILSRCQCFDFKPLTVNEIGEKIKEVCKEEKFEITEEAVVAIGESAEGGLRDALSYLDQAIALADNEINVDVVNDVTGNLSYDKIIEICEYVEQKQTEEALQAISELVNMGKEISKVVISLVSFYRDALLFKTFDTSHYSKYIFKKEKFQKLASELSEEKIYYNVDILNDVQSKIKYSLTPQVFLEIGIIKMINVGSGDLDFIKRISVLENKIENIPDIQEGTLPVDDSKVRNLEMNFAKMTSELSKLELYKLSDKVSVIEKKLLNGTERSEDNNYLEDLKKVQKDIVALKDVSKSTNHSYIDGRLTIIEEKLNDIGKNNSSDDFIDRNISFDDSDINKRMNELSKQIEEISKRSFQKADERLVSLEKGLTKVETDNKINQAIQPIYELIKKLDKSEKENLEVLELKEKISNIEEKLYRLISDKLAAIPAPIKKTKKEVNSGQVFLVGDDVMRVVNLEKKKKESFDFAEIQKEPELENIQDDFIKTKEISEEISDESKEAKEKTFIEEKQVEEPKDINEMLNDEIFKLFKKDIPKVEDKKIEEEVPKKLIDDEVLVYETKDEKVVKKKNSEVVIRTKPKEEKREESNLFQKEFEFEAEETLKREKDVSQEIINNNEKEKEISILKEEASKSNKEKTNEAYSNYSSEVILKIMNDALTIEAKNDKARIIKLWDSLHDAVSSNDLQIANILSRGKVSAVGINEFIIVYDDAVICNQVMTEEFKKRSLKVLYDILGDTYNYMALPEKDFIEKRTEYAGYYQMGTKPKSLTPIDNPDLKIMDRTEEYNPKQDMLAMAKAEFGEEIVRMEED